MDFEEPVPDQGIYVDAEQYLGLERDKGEVRDALVVRALRIAQKAPENINIFGFVMQKPKPAVEMAIMALFALISHHAYSTMQVRNWSMKLVHFDLKCSGVGCSQERSGFRQVPDLREHCRVCHLCKYAPALRCALPETDVQYHREDVATPKSPLRLMGAVGLLQAIVLFLSNRAASSSTSGAQVRNTSS